MRIWWRRLNLRGWLMVLLVVLVLRWVWLEPRRIPSASMEPTLQGTNDGWRSWVTSDRVAVDKFIYGPRFPFNRVQVPFTNFFIHYADRRMFTRGQPERWDVVVFKGVEAQNPGEVIIKRVVGLPGEEVHIADGFIHVNGEPVEPPEDLREILRYTTAPDDAAVRRFIVQLAQLPGPPPILNPNHDNSSRLIAHLERMHPQVRGRATASLGDDEIAELVGDIHTGAFAVAQELLDMQHAELGTFRYGIFPDDAYRVIPDKAYFLLGDNSGQSRDGRAFGWVPEEHIMGRAFCIWWPLGRWRDFTGFSRTWYGVGLMVGLPLLAFLYDILIRFVVQSQPVCHPVGDSTLRLGERVLVDKRAYGWRVPFTSKRIPSSRAPRRGELVAYPVDRLGVRLGFIAALPGDRITASGGSITAGGQVWPVSARPKPLGSDGMEERSYMMPDGEVLIVSSRPGSRANGYAEAQMPLRQVLGPVRAAWWPPWRARRTSIGGESPIRHSSG